jgi:hypothetical protein
VAQSGFHVLCDKGAIKPEFLKLGQRVIQSNDVNIGSFFYLTIVPFVQ